MGKNLDRRKAKKVAKPPKKLEEYVHSRPAQLALFELLEPGEIAYSNAVELYDFIPKYYWGKVERVDGTLLHPLQREFECRGVKYKAVIQPASVKGQDGIYRSYFPGKREELVEDALRKFAVEGKGVFLDDEAGVIFSLHQLQNELQSMGHTYSKNELKEALLVCAQTRLVVESDDGRAILVSGLFETLGLQTREDWQGTGAKTKAFVRFNSMVTNSIKKGTYRPFNYEKSMGFRNVVARQLHKRMAYFFRQASITEQYNILLTTIIRDFGLTRYKQLRDNLRHVENALAEMREKNVALHWKIERTLEGESGTKLIEAKFIITPHPEFAKEVMRANDIVKKR